MTTIREVKRFAAPLLARNPDLTLICRMIVVRPVRHVLRFVYVDATGDRRRCRPCWSMFSLIGKRDIITLFIDGDLYRRNDLWWLEEPGVAEEFADVAERDALPILRDTDTLEKYVAWFFKTHRLFQKEEKGARFLFALALGRLDEARNVMRETPDSGYVTAFNEDEPGLGDRILARGAQLSADDRAALARIFHEREAYTVAKLKLESVWEKSPLPLEAMSFSA